MMFNFFCWSRDPAKCNVKEMAAYAKAHNMNLLSDYSATFWQDYVTNHVVYDRMFARLYSSYRYYNQEIDDNTHEYEVADATTDFIDAVKTFLMLNNKKYSELYRLNVVSNYDITSNYSITETMAKEISDSGNKVEGARTDSTAVDMGAKSDTLTEGLNTTVSASGTNVNGAQTNENTHTIAGFNSSGFENADKTVDASGQRTDTSQTSTATTGTNTNTNSYGAQHNESSFTKGSQTNTETHTGSEEYTLTKEGNIGVKTVSEILKEHEDLWTPYEFYTLIFKDICAALLLV